jgi:light-regulated signal transduction histidine kinase (bacteriophytochrome)
MVGVDDRPRQLLIRTEREDGDRVRVTVRDAGTGFDRQSMDNLFEAFTRRRATAWVSGSQSAAPSSRDIMVVFGQNRMTDLVPPSRFPFPAVQKASRTRHR